jgi:hypothetical protein
MRVTRARVGFAMALAWMCFGCHGVHGLHGGGLHIAAPHIAPIHVPAVIVPAVAVRGAATGMAIADAASSTSHGAEGAVAQASADGYDAPPPCVELPPEPELSGGPPLRTLDCRGHLVVLDPNSGLWRLRR